MVFLLHVKHKMINAIAGTMKRSLPKISRQRKEQPSPVRADLWSVVSSH